MKKGSFSNTNVSVLLIGFDTEFSSDQYRIRRDVTAGGTPELDYLSTQAVSSQINSNQKNHQRSWWWDKEELKKLTLSKFLSKITSEYPKQNWTIYLGSFWSRYDLGVFSDWRKWISQCDHVQKTILSLKSPLQVKLFYPGSKNVRSTAEVWLRDLKTLSPAGSSLEKLGERLGLEKIQVDRSRMKNLREENFELFKSYGLRDAEITWRWMIEINEILNLEGKIPPTLQTHQLEQLNFSKVEVPKTIQPWTTESFLGGRNEAFWLGRRAEGWLIDLRQAYAVGLSKVWSVDYQNAKWREGGGRSEVEHAFKDHEIIARIDFKGQGSIPRLPIKDLRRRGLLFTSEGNGHFHWVEIEKLNPEDISIRDWIQIPRTEKKFSKHIEKMIQARLKAENHDKDIDTLRLQLIVHSNKGKGINRCRTRKD